MIEIRPLRKEDIPTIVGAFRAIGSNKPASQYQAYLAEQAKGVREVLAAFTNGEFAGYLTLLWESSYPPFREQNIPEINDFNVLPAARRKGVGTKLMDEAERIIARRSETAGIGVGLDADYGPAQRLYVLRGYVPDGKGIVWRNRFPKYGERVTVDDDLNLYLTKTLTKTLK